MSLRGFHIVFLSVCLVLFGFLLLWGLVLADDMGGVSVTLVASGAVGLLCLPIYGWYFLKKSKAFSR